MSDAKGSVEEVAELLRSIELGTDSEAKDLHLARWALRFRARGVREALEGASKAVPTNWCDPILTGEQGIGSSPYTEGTIEAVLRRVRNRIEALAAEVPDA